MKRSYNVGMAHEIKKSKVIKAFLTLNLYAQ